jgi:glutathione S-transferase
MALLIPVLRAVLPHIGTILSAASPAFSSRTADPEIAELRAAVSANAANTKELAEQLERTVTALDETARVAEARLRLALWMAGGALTLAAAALVLAMVAFSG